MPVETVEAGAWRHLDVARDAIDLERTRRLQALAPGESISFIDAPPPPPASLTQAQSAGSSANESQAQTQTQTQTQTAAAPQAASAQQVADALQAHMHALQALNLSPFGGLGGGAAALFSHASAVAAAAEAAAAASNVAPAPPAQPAPTASADQIAFNELLLADPLLKEVVAQYCPDAPTSLPSNATTDALVAQYGHDLTCRLLQATTAIVRVFDDYRDEMDRVATEGADAGGSGWVFTAGTPGSGDTDGTPDKWHFDAALFTADYAKGDSLAARAFASFHGDDGRFAQITRTLCGTSDAGDMYTVNSGGIDPLSAQFIRYDVGDGGSEMRWESARMGSHNALVQVDLSEPQEMYDPKAVWFEPTLGFVTANENIVPEDDTVENIVIAVVIGVVTWGIGTVVCQGVNVAVASATGGAIMGATGAVIGGLFQNGTVHFEDVVRGAVVGAIVGAVSEKLDVKGIDPKTGAVTDWGARLGAIGSKATIQGMLAELTGGEFKDAFGQGLASGLAAEVGRSITAEINKAIDAKTITAEQASAYRTFGRAVTTAISALANPDGDPVLANFATDFLGDLLKAEIPLPTVRDTVHADPSSTAAADDGFELNFDGLIDQAAATSGASITTDATNATETQGAPAQVGITEREQQGIEQSDDILFNRGDELAAANGTDPQILPDGRIQYPDGRIRTPTVEVITHPAQRDGSDGSFDTAASGDASQGETTDSRIPTDNGQSVRTSIYGSECTPVSGYVGPQPVGGHENLTPASDLPLLSTEFTPNFLDGRTGKGIPYRDQAGQVFYRTFDANGTEKGLVAVAEGPSPLPLANLAITAAPFISAGLTAESRSGALPLVFVAGATLAGAELVIALRNGDTFSREALDPEQVRSDRLPLINVPVSPGPGGTPGYVADSRDTSTPGFEVTARPLDTSTTIPIVEQSWEDLIVDASAPKWTLVNGVPYRSDLAAHLTGPDGFKGGKLFGSHNLEVATSLLQGSNYWLTPTSTPGIFELNYDYLDPSTGTRTVASPPKTVYDPAVISDQSMMDAATRAGNQAWASYTAATGVKPITFIVIESGIKFQVYINTDQGNAYVGNVHPIR